MTGPKYHAPATWIAEMTALAAEIASGCTCGTNGDGDCRSYGCDPACPECGDLPDLTTDEGTITPMELLGLELNHDEEGDYFLATYANDDAIERWLAIPLDPIGSDGHYEGRLQLVGRTA